MSPAKLAPLGCLAVLAYPAVAVSASIAAYKSFGIEACVAVAGLFFLHLLRGTISSIAAPEERES